MFPYVDANYFYYNRVEKRIGVLEKAVNLDKAEIEKNSILSEEYDSILNEISKQKEGSLGSVFITKNSNEVNKYKFLSGALLSWLVAIMFLFIKMDRWWYKLIGLFVFLLLGVGIGYFSKVLPTVISPLCNYIVMPIMQIIILGILVTSGDTKD